MLCITWKCCKEKKTRWMLRDEKTRIYIYNLGSLFLIACCCIPDSFQLHNSHYHIFHCVYWNSWISVCLRWLAGSWSLFPCSLSIAHSDEQQNRHFAIKVQIPIQFWKDSLSAVFCSHISSVHSPAGDPRCQIGPCEVSRLLKEVHHMSVHQWELVHVSMTIRL